MSNSEVVGNGERRSPDSEDSITETNGKTSVKERLPLGPTPLKRARRYEAVARTVRLAHSMALVFYLLSIEVQGCSDHALIRGGNEAAPT